MSSSDEHTVFPIVDLLIPFLRFDASREEPYTFASGADRAIAMILDTVFSLPKDPAAELDALLELVCALELELRSPGAASLLRAALAADPRVAAALGVTDVGVDPSAAVRWGGRVDVKHAPMYGAAAPQGTIKAGAMVESGSGPRVRATRATEPRGCPAPTRKATVRRRAVRVV